MTNTERNMIVLYVIKNLYQQVVDKHISSVHEGKMPYLCSQCGFSCADKGILKYHIAGVHEGKKPYPC